MYRGHVFIPIPYYFTLPFCMSMTLHNTLSLCLIVHKWNIIILWHSRIRTDLTLSRKFRSEKWYCSSLNIAGICIWTTNYLIHYKVDNRTYLTNIKCICSNVPFYRTSFLSQELKASSSRSDWCIWKYDIHNLQFCIAPVYTKTKSFQYDRRTKQCKKIFKPNILKDHTWICECSTLWAHVMGRERSDRQTNGHQEDWVKDKVSQTFRAIVQSI